jgi:hypothetical protein
VSAGAPSGGVAKIDEKLLLDWGARIGAAARSENLERTQIENIIASLDALQSREALLATAAFALRQAQRLHTGRTTARLISQALLDLYEKGAGKDEARKALGFAKWVYEALAAGFRGRPEQLTLESLLRQLAGGGR